jgi:hypothetical protein
MKLINFLNKIICEQPIESDKFIVKGLITSEKYDGNIFELSTDRHGVDRAKRPENTSDVTKSDIIDKFRRALPQLNKRFFGKYREEKSPIVDRKYINKDNRSGKITKYDSPKFVIVEVKDDFCQIVLLIRDYDKNSNYISFEIVTILKDGTPLSNLYNPAYHVQKLNIFLEHVVKSEIIYIFV